ncbi:MAG TPA: tRNA pseudouridine(13) synthase TruD [Steroidobacteraceae bacterium]|nr:tRNA pseudouridine(13) synthase TruD [Steroidobacteraceae bacterium]
MPYEIAPSFQNAHGHAVITARLKALPEHFIVREWLGFAPDNEGDHMLVIVRKRGANTMWVAKQLARFATCDARDVGFAGLKDRHAITEQAFTVPSRQLQPNDWLQCKGDGYEVIEAHRQRRKLKRGAHKGNAFEIVLTNVVGDESALNARLDLIRQLGVPNYFGLQRFGRDGDNLTMARDWFENGKIIEDRHQRGFALSAARAYLFNLILQARIQQRTWNQLLNGDVANLSGSNSVFAVDQVDDVLANRCKEFDIHPTGALWGKGDLRSQGAVKELELRIADECISISQGLIKAGLEQERRALRVQVRDLNWKLENNQLTLQFSLAKGAFATAVLAELVGSSAEALTESEDS